MKISPNLRKAVLALNLIEGSCKYLEELREIMEELDDACTACYRSIPCPFSKETHEKFEQVQAEQIRLQRLFGRYLNTTQFSQRKTVPLTCRLHSTKQDDDAFKARFKALSDRIATFESYPLPEID